VSATVFAQMVYAPAGRSVSVAITVAVSAVWPVIGAVKHSILVATWHMLSTGELYREPGGDYFERRRDPEREVKRLIAQLQRLGQNVTLGPTNPGPAPA